MNKANVATIVNRCIQITQAFRPLTYKIKNTELSLSFRVWLKSNSDKMCNNPLKLKQVTYFFGSPWRCGRTRLLKSHQKTPSLCRSFSSKAGGQSGDVPKIALWKRVAVVASVGGLVAYMYYSVQRDKEIREEQVRYEEFKKAQLGGDWTLTDHHGNKRSSTDFRGQWILMYFGFTHCPDICPEELEKLVGIVKSFDDDPKLPSMMPIFVTLDPERDTPAVIKDYLSEFKCPRLLGFTAPESTIREVATRYRAYFSKGPADEDNDYIVDHTIIIYLINPKGEFVNYFDRSRTAERIIKTVTEHIEKFNELEGREK